MRSQNSPHLPPAREHAVVIGAGIAGLFAARVLAETYTQVTVLDRDVLPTNGEPRAGAPQGRHVHAVLVRGSLAIRELFPGLVEDLVAAGTPVGDLLAHSRAYSGPYRLVPAHCGLEGIYISRPNLEHHVRGRLAELPNVTVKCGHTVMGLTASADGTSVTGLRVVDGGDRERQLNCDLVVDAAGRGSRTPQWLAEIGYEPPLEQRVRIDVAYSSCALSLPPGVVGDVHTVVVGPTPQNPRGGALIHIGGGQWLLSLTGYRDTPPPVDLAGISDFARQLAVPDIADALRHATMTGNGVRFRMPDAVRRRYEQLTRHPNGLVVIGDAATTFNPIYGQGMSVAAQQALELQRHLQTHGPRMLPQLRAQIARSSETAWTMSVNYDLRMPWIKGRRTPAVRLGNRYLALLHRAAVHDAHVAKAFVRVVNLIDAPPRIARPSIASRVLIRGLLPMRRHRLPTTGSTS